MSLIGIPLRSTVIRSGTSRYNLNNPTSIDEGSTLWWGILWPSYLNNSSFYYRINGIDSSDTDDNLSGNWTSSGSFYQYISIDTSEDQKTEGAETIEFELYTDSTYNNLVASSSTILNDTSTLPNISITVPAESDEGDTVKWSITGLKAYNYYYYRISGIDSNDTNNSLNNSFYSYGSPRDISIKTVADQLTEGSETIKFEIFTDSAYSNLVSSVETKLNDTSTTPAITITGSAEISEGDSITWNIKGAVYNRKYYYRITGIDSKDTNTQLTGYFTGPYYSNSSVQRTLRTLSDQITEGSETIKFELFQDASYKDLAASATTTLKDTSTSPSHNITVATEIKEGDTLKWSITDMINYQYYYYRITGIDSPSDTSSRLTGSFRNYGSPREISITTLADQTTEGTETINFELFKDPNYTDLAASATSSLNDTSTDPIPQIILPNEIKEGSSASFKITNLKGGTYYYRINDESGKFSELDSTNDLSGIIRPYSTSSTTTRSITFTADHETEGEEKAKFEIFDNETFIGQPILSQEFSVQDTSTDRSKLTYGEKEAYGSPSFQNNPSTIEEGKVFTFNLTGLGAVTYYWKFDGIDKDDINGSITGNFRPYSDGERQIQFEVKSDDLTEGEEKVTFTLAKDDLFSKIIQTAELSIIDTSQDPKPEVEVTSKNIRSNEGESADIEISISTFPKETTNLYWELSGTGLTKDDLATRFGDLSEMIDLKNHYFSNSRSIRGTQYSSGSYDFEIPFDEDQTTEGTETYQLKFYDNEQLDGDPLATSSVTVFDTSIDPPKSNFNSALIDKKTINIYFSAPINSTDIAPSYLKVTSGSINIPVVSVSLNDLKNAATVTLRTEPEAESLVNISYISSANSILQSFNESIKVDDLSTPVPISGIAYEDRIELRFSEKLKDGNLPRSAFEVKASNRLKKIESAEVIGDDGIVIIALKNKIDINDDLVEVDYFDLTGNQSKNVLEDKSGNDVNTFKGFAVTNEVSNADDISVILAEAEENIITLGFDIEIDENSIPNTGMFRVSVNGNKSKINGIQLSAKKREAYLDLKYPISNGDVVTLSYIDAKGNQKDNIIQSKYGGDLGSFKNLSVENLSAVSVDPPGIDEAYYDEEMNAVILEFDEIISGSKIRNSRFKLFTPIERNGKLKNKRVKVSDVVSYEDDSIVEIILKKEINPSTQQMFLDYRDPKGNQKSGVIEDLQGNDLLSLKGLEIEL